MEHPTSAHSSCATFRGEYRGGCHQAFLNVLKEYANVYSKNPSWKSQYCSSVAIIQSSGMGKSRMIQEVSTQVFTIPINICEPLPEGMMTHFPPDDVVRDYFNAPTSKTDKHLQVECAIFLNELFKHSLETIHAQGFSRRKTLPDDWARYLMEGDNRTRFFTTVVERANRVRDNHSIVANTRILGKYINEMANSCRVLVGEILSGEGHSKLPLLVSFDEAGHLTHPRGEPDHDRTLSWYQNLQKVLAHIRDQWIFFLFLSASTSLLQHPPIRAPASHPSARSFDLDGTYLFPPITELPFDIYSKDSLSKMKPLTLEKMSTVAMMAVFGRPLWYEHYQQRQEGHSDLLDTIELGTAKLQPPGTSDIAYLAAIGIRVGLAFDPAVSHAREVEGWLVDQHMRVVIAIPSHLEYIRTCASSEPILAEAAGHVCDIGEHGARILNDSFKAEILADNLRDVIGRLFWTFAHDVALPPTPQVPGFGAPRYHRPIKVIDLLKGLFNSRLHDKILTAKPIGNSYGPDLQTAFSNSYAFFSHFAIAANQEMLSVENMYVGLIRGMAFYTSHAEVVIPIHMGDLSDPISPKTTSAIHVHFENRQTCRPVCVDRSITVPDTSVPALSVVMELGASLTDECGPLDLAPVLADNNLHPEANHYSIVAYGHGPETYGV